MNKAQQTTQAEPASPVASAMIEDGLPAGLVRAGKIEEAKAPAKAKAQASTPVKAKEAKASKVKAAPKAKTAKQAPHRPTEIERTTENPQKSIVPMRFKERYSEHDDSNGDKIANALKKATTKTNADGRPSLDLDALAKVARANEIDPSAYDRLNNGQKRMNVGNKLRGRLKAGHKVVIGNQTFADAKKALARPAATAEAS